MSLEGLKNKGIVSLGNDNIDNIEKTIIIVGVARGGTSLVSGVLDHLGVFTGERSKEPVYEDVKLAEFFECELYDEAQNVIDNYNIDHQVWAFKRPSSINYLDKINKMVRNPYYIFIFKDILSIANRNSISMKMDIVDGLKKAQKDYDKILKYLGKNDLNGLIFSYEKVMQNKNDLLEACINLVGKDKISEEQVSNAKKFIDPNPEQYLDLTRVTKAIGRIGSVEKDKIIGWGKYLHTDQPGVVELYINDKLIQKKVAKDFRQNILDSGQHPTGYCGYIFELSENPLSNGDKISVKLEDDIVFLNASNQIYKD